MLFSEAHALPEWLLEARHGFPFAFAFHGGFPVPFQFLGLPTAI